MAVFQTVIGHSWVMWFVFDAIQVKVFEFKNLALVVELCMTLLRKKRRGLHITHTMKKIRIHALKLDFLL